MRKKKNILTILAIVIILILGPTFLLRKIKKTSAAWFDDGYGYRTAITITNSGATVSNQKVKLDIDTATLYTAGKIQINCNDSKFTDAK